MSQERYFTVTQEPSGNLPPEIDPADARGKRVDRIRLLWEQRKYLLRWTGIGMAVSILIALLIPSRYQATTQLMPPDGQSGSGMALLSALAGKAGGMGSIAGDLIGMKNSGALFIGVSEQPNCAGPDG